MASLRKIGKNWFYRFIDENGKQRERKGCADKRETDRMASAAETEAANIRQGFIDPKALGYRKHESRPLTDHLTDFEASLAAKGGSRQHPPVTRNRAAKLARLAGVGRLADLSLSKVQVSLGKLRAEGLGQETINHHIRAIKAFSRWLWRDGRTREHQLAHLATASSEGDRRRRRRALTPTEATRLVAAARSGPIIKQMSGPDRARCYELAMGTGLRASELATLTPERFDLIADPPTVTVPAAYTKNGREATQPLARSLAERLAPWLATLPTNRPLFPSTRRAAEMLRVDLIAADILYETASGYADFHSLRGVYISNLVASGASVKTCQTLARHSTPSLTIGVYAKASLRDIGGAIAALPDLDPLQVTSERLAATGTQDQHSSNNSSLYFPYTGDGISRDLSVQDGKNHNAPGSIADPGASHNPMKIETLDGIGRSESGSVGGYQQRGSDSTESDPLKDLGSCAARREGSTPSSRIF